MLITIGSLMVEANAIASAWRVIEIDNSFCDSHIGLEKNARFSFVFQNDYLRNIFHIVCICIPEIVHAKCILRMLTIALSR